MKKFSVALLSISLLVPSVKSVQASAKDELHAQYELHCNRISDINEHVPVLKNLAEECSSAMEIGIRSMVSSWGIFQGLAENSTTVRSYVGVDLN